MIKPILFNTEMVQAILDERNKTMTRRVIKPQIPDNVIKLCDVDPLGYMSLQSTNQYLDGWENRKSQYAVGDILWVRESAMIQSMKNGEKSVKFLFRADDTLQEFSVSDEFYEKLSRYPQDKWLSPYWLTKEAARIFLKVTDVRAERLQDITVDDCRAEGIFDNYKATSEIHHKALAERAYPLIYSELWNSTINKKDLDLYGWDANPRVFVYTFKKILMHDPEYNDFKCVVHDCRP